MNISKKNDPRMWAKWFKSGAVAADAGITPIADIGVPERYKSFAAKFRTLANEAGVPATSPICYKVGEKK